MYALKGEHTELIDVLLETGLVDLTVATKVGLCLPSVTCMIMRADITRVLCNGSLV